MSETSDAAQSRADRYRAQLEAMRIVGDALASLQSEDVRVVLEWAHLNFGAKVSTPSIGSTPIETPNPPSQAGTRQFETLADLFAAASPSSGPERALVVGYWHQVVEGRSEFEGAAVNSELRHLGYQLPNVTTTMSLLMTAKPALAIQTKKTGTSQQARKLYRLTDAGIRKVALMLRGADTP